MQQTHHNGDIMKTGHIEYDVVMTLSLVYYHTIDYLYASLMQLQAHSYLIMGVVNMVFPVIIKT